MALDNFKINMEGDKELQAALNNIETKVAAKVIRPSVREAAKLIMREAKARAPIMDSGQHVGSTTQMPTPGTLRKGIRVHAGKRKKHHYRVNVDFKGRAAMGIPSADTKGFGHYAPMVVEAGRRSSKKYGPAEGAHFMIEAYAQKRQGADAIIVGKTRDGLIKFWRSNTRRPR